MDTYKGLTEELITQDGGKPFEVNQYLCTHCGLQTDYKEHETLCVRCRHPLDKTKKTARTIHKKQVKDIIDNKLVYKCPVCKKVYDVPTVCCSAQHVIDPSNPTKLHGKKIDGYMCLGCETIYTQPTRCCSGSMMVRGDVYPEMSIEEFKKVRTGISKPVEGIIQ